MKEREAFLSRVLRVLQVRKTRRKTVKETSKEAAKTVEKRRLGNRTGQVLRLMLEIYKYESHIYNTFDTATILVDSSVFSFCY